MYFEFVSIIVRVYGRFIFSYAHLEHAADVLELPNIIWQMCYCDCVRVCMPAQLYVNGDSQNNNKHTHIHTQCPYLDLLP